MEDRFLKASVGYLGKQNGDRTSWQTVHLSIDAPCILCHSGCALSLALHSSHTKKSNIQKYSHLTSFQSERIFHQIATPTPSPVS